MTLNSISRVDFSNYAAGVSRMVTALNDRANQDVARLHDAGPQPMMPRAMSVESLASSVGIFEQISVGIEQAAASSSQAAAAYLSQA